MAREALQGCTLTTCPVRRGAGALLEWGVCRGQAVGSLASPHALPSCDRQWQEAQEKIQELQASQEVRADHEQKIKVSPASLPAASQGLSQGAASCARCQPSGSRLDLVCQHKNPGFLCLPLRAGKCPSELLTEPGCALPPGWCPGSPWPLALRVDARCLALCPGSRLVPLSPWPSTARRSGSRLLPPSPWPSTFRHPSGGHLLAFLPVQRCCIWPGVCCVALSPSLTRVPGLG